MNLLSNTILSRKIEELTAGQSGFETSRSYLSLSNAIKSVDELVKDYHEGYRDGHEIRLKCYKGYQMEKDLKRRIFEIDFFDIKEHEEISVYNGLVKGHPDFKLEDPLEVYPGDCKSVPLDEHLPEKFIPKKVYWQMNAYMLYSERSRSVVIYESRESGRIRDYIIKADLRVMNDIDTKYKCAVERILKAA